MQRTKSKILSILLSLVMLLSLLPTTALAAGYYDKVEVNGILLQNGYYLESNSSEGAKTGAFTTAPTPYVAWYKDGVLTLNDYDGKGIETQGVAAGELTVKLIGTNSINNGSLVSDNGGDITVTSDSSGTLSISKTTSGSNPAIGIETGLSGSYTTGNVTITGDAKVTINVTHNGTSTYERAYGIYAKKNITISKSASVDITCATPYNTTGGGNCNGLYAAQNVTIDTNGTIKIDVTKAGKDDGYSFGVYPMGTATLTKVGEMEVQWKKHATHSSFPGGAVYKGASLSDTDYAINVDETNCYASYRFGTPRNVTVQDGQLTGPGVKYANGSGYFLAGDKVNITPATKKGTSGEVIPFQKWTSEQVTFTSPEVANNSFTVSDKNVTVTAKHNPFVDTPTFTPIGMTGTEGTLTFKTKVTLGDGSESFALVKEVEVDDTTKYKSINPSTASPSSPYEYSSTVNFNNFPAGNYYVAEKLNGAWYLSEKFTVSYTAAPTTYTVSFDANGGTGSMGDVTGVSGEYTLPACTFTAPTDKQFKAWSVGGVEKAVGDKITVTANTTVTAVWEDIPVVTYTVSFDANGGTGSMGDVTGVSGEYTLPACTFTAPTDKQFKAWSVGGVEKAVGDKITVTANTTVTAVWEDIPVVTYTVSFDANGGTGSMGDVTGVSGEYTLPACTFTAPTDKQFKAWSVGGVEKAVGDKITVTANTTVNAVWEAIEYNVTVTGGTASVGAGTPITKATMGTTVTLTAGAAPSGKVFDKWEVVSGGITLADANSATTTFTMPASAVSVKATYKTYTGGGGGGGSYTPSYTVSVDKTENGTITVSPKSASKGDAVTITVKPDKGYELDTLKVLDKNGDKVKLTEKNGKYTFTMPTGKVTVKGSFVEEAPVQIFKDVPVDAYYYEAVKWAAEKGITGGVGNGLFAPNQPCTRAQIVTFLWRAAGSPAPKHMSSFADVPADAFYAKAVAWAVENGITGGTGDGKFSPDATCTRAQSVTFLYRAAGSPKVSSSAEFGDVATNAYYADAVAWAAKNDITGGIGGGLFGSDNNCTRAQIVTFLYRAMK